MVHSVGGVVYVYTQNIFISGEGVLTLRIILSMVILTTQKYFIGVVCGWCCSPTQKRIILSVGVAVFATENNLIQSILSRNRGG